MCYHLIGRIYLAANLSESDNEDIQPPPPPPLPRTKGIPQRSRTEARTGNAEELFDDDGEDEQYERGEEEDDGEDLENHEACVDFNAEVRTTLRISNRVSDLGHHSRLHSRLQVSSLVV